MFAIIIAIFFAFERAMGVAFSLELCKGFEAANKRA
jgi:hypothetical protein